MSFKYCWHGTNQQNAEKILKEGFKAWTYFACHFEDAIEFGSDFVFLGEFASDEFDGGGPNEWQFRFATIVQPKKIISLVEYTERTLFSRSPTPPSPARQSPPTAQPGQAPR